MAAINTLGVDHLSLRGAGTTFHRFSRFFTDHAEAQAAIDSGDWTPAIGLHNICVTGEGLMIYDHDSKTLSFVDSGTRTYVDTQISELVTNGPSVLAELTNIAGQLEDDADYVTEIKNKIDADIEVERTRAANAEADLAADIVTINTEITDIKDGFDFTGKITAPVDENVIPFYFADQDRFPEAANAHGAVAHSHDDGAMYFAHGGAWHRLLHEGASSTLLTDMGLYVSVATLQDIVANSADFDEFKSNIADSFGAQKSNTKYLKDTQDKYASLFKIK